MMKSTILLLSLVFSLSSCATHRASHRDRAKKILSFSDDFVQDRSSVLAAAARGRSSKSSLSSSSNLLSSSSSTLEAPRFAEKSTELVFAGSMTTVAGMCPRWGKIDAPDGEAPVPRRGGFAFTMRASNGVTRLVVGGGERRDGGGAPKILKKLRFLSLGAAGKKKWINPSPSRSVGADKVWRKNAATVWMPSDTDGEEGDLFMYGGMTSESSEPSKDARVLRVSKDTNNMFKWYAVAQGTPQTGVMSLSSQTSPKNLQRSTLTNFGDNTRALLFGGDDGAAVQGGTWILTRKKGREISSWSWEEHKATVGETIPAGRTGHSAISFNDRDGSIMIMIFGGQGQGGEAIDDGINTFLFATETGTWRAVPRTALDIVPKTREGHTMTYMPEDHAVYLFGGCQPWNGMNCFNDLWRYDVDNNSWKEIIFDSSYVLPPSVEGQNSFKWTIKNSMMIFGGLQSNTGDMGDTSTPWILELNGVCGKDDCQHGSAFNNGKCVCGKGWKGDKCEAVDMVPQPSIECLNNCSSQGICLNGGCVCHDGFNGTDCSQKIPCPNCPETASGCPNDCSNNGRCTTLDDGMDTKECSCGQGFKGNDCSLVLCPGDPVECSGHGECNDFDGTCKCSPGFAGDGCGMQVTACPSNCTDAAHGTCSEVSDGVHQCICMEGFSGPACSIDARCPIDMPSIEACFGHGSCVEEKCQCDEGFFGEFCALRKCLSDCSGHGKCNETHTGLCTCGVDYAGEDCSTKLTCENDCGDHGGCWEDKNGVAIPPYDGICKCDKPFSGTACQYLPCPSAEDVDNGGEDKECSGRGKCNREEGLCACDIGFAGPACEAECNNKCSGHGICFSSVIGPNLCDCEPGYRGVSCQLKDKCLNDCSNNGVCSRGECECHPGFFGEDCSVDGCKNNKCSGHGKCVHGNCFCVPGFEGEDCSRTKGCPLGCSGHGECLHGRCYCAASWLGDDCGTAAVCPRGCSSRGVCIRGTCQCQPGFTGAACETISKKVNVAVEAKIGAATSEEMVTVSPGCGTNCSNHGKCMMGKCFCDPLWGDQHCDKFLPPKCPVGKTTEQGILCSGRGFCSAEGLCSCYTGFSGEDCSIALKCHDDCNSHGVCFNGRCFCDPGFSAEYCEKREPCPGSPQCMDRGLCINGMCVCEPGFGGLDCATVELGADICPTKDKKLTCSGHGECQVGKCFCEPGFIGEDCATINDAASCPAGCSGNGLCYSGRCICNPGWRGVACAEIVSCEAGCSGHGQCKHGHCFCTTTWGGNNCSKLLTEQQMPQGGALRITDTCPNGCSMHGICFKGKCLCRAGWLGIDCSRRDTSWTKADACPNDCRGSYASRPHGEFGLCLFDKCFCYPGFGGPGCDEIMPLRCPNNCNDRGVCSHGKCFCDLGFTGEDCGKRISCPRAVNDTLECSGQGICHMGRCDCNPGFQGVMCQSKMGLGCKNECHGHGSCQMGACFCDPGYEGDDCGILNQPLNNGETKRGEKPKLPGGPNVHTRVALGAVVTGGFAGDAQTAIHNNRLKHRLTMGPIISGSKFVNVGDANEHDSNKNMNIVRKEPVADSLRFKETPIVVAAPDCPRNCSGSRGACTLRDGKEMCDCSPGYHGTSCEYVEDCGTHGCENDGVCRYGTCFCAPGFEGKHCQTMEPCPIADCAGNGICRGGKCFCKPGFVGDGCEEMAVCPGTAANIGGRLACSGHGVCSAGVCYCDETHEGTGCEVPRNDAKQCYQDCNSHGLCKHGRCFCSQGYAGVGCEIEVSRTEEAITTSNLVANVNGGSNTKDVSGSKDGGLKFSKFTLAVLGVGACIVGLIAGVVIMQKMRRKNENNYYYINGDNRRWDEEENNINVDSTSPFHLHAQI